MTKYILLETLLGESIPHLPVGLQIPLMPYQWCVMYYPQNLILEFGLKDKIDLVFVVDKTGEGVLGVFHQKNGFPIC